MQGEAGHGAGQHRAQMRGQIVFPAVEQVLQVQSGLGLALHREPALEEQRVGILFAARERDEVREPAADRHVGRTRRWPQPAGDDLEADLERDVLDAQAQVLALELRELRGERLAAQQLVDREREQPGLQCRRRKPQQRSDHGGRIGHGELGHGTLRSLASAHSCHAAPCDGLISVNATCARDHAR